MTWKYEKNVLESNVKIIKSEYKIIKNMIHKFVCCSFSWAEKIEKYIKNVN